MFPSSLTGDKILNMDLSKLNEKQREAVKITDGPLLILAGAGSGKTSTMTHRIAYMIEQGTDPHSILAVTFTNKAATEMRERIEALCGSTDGMWIMTFHAMCLRMLRFDAEVIGYDRNFVIYDTTDQKTIIKNIVREQNLNTDEFKVAYLLSVISDKKEKDISDSAYARAAGTDRRSRTLSNVYSAYEKALRENNAMDFDDLLLNTLRMFRTDEKTLLKYRDRFRYIMVDEYQDTNRVQYELVRMLAEGRDNICVVGDDDQCIYQWRGADIRNILDFERDFPKTKVIKLEQNYRSVGNILTAAHSVIRNNRSRKNKELWTNREDGEKITYHRADNEHDEADFIAGEIGILRSGGLKYSDFAVLYRTNAQSRQFEQAFTNRSIPYRVLSGVRYYDRKEIKDMMAYMRLVLNPRDELSMRRIINEPKRGIGPKTMDKLIVLAAVRGETLLDALCNEEVLCTLPAKSRESVAAMVHAIKACGNERDSISVFDIYDNLLVKTGYLAALEAENTVEAESRTENLMEFKSAILDYETEVEEPSLEEFMEKIALMSDVDNHDENEDAVVMMTIHSAKGLEFPVVFMPGMEDGLFPGHRSLDSAEGMDEERRLCYVGMTRARERLFLTGATVRTLYGRTDYTRESQFLRELDKDILTGDGIYERRRGVFGRDGAISGPGVYTGTIDGAGVTSKAGYKPFDFLKYAKEETRKAASGDTVFSPGDKVRHRKFGDGLVTECGSGTVTVIFDGEVVKKMAIGIAPLTKL